MSFFARVEVSNAIRALKNCWCIARLRYFQFKNSVCLAGVCRSSNCMLQQDEHKRRVTRAWRGAIFHSLSLSDLEVVEDGIIAIYDDGTIALVHKHIANKGNWLYFLFSIPSLFNSCRALLQKEMYWMKYVERTRKLNGTPALR